jgi:hypothetical protein
VLAVAQHVRAVDEHVAHAHRKLVGALEGRAIGDRRGIEDDDVGEQAFLQAPAPVEPEVRRRESAAASPGCPEADLRVCSRS